MKLKITINMENAAFSNDDNDSTSGREAARILRELADDFAARDLLPDESIVLMDINGNKCGQAKVTQ